MTTEIRISAKDLGAMALEDFCPRCFWLKRKSKGAPWSIFPGIFSSLDAHQKHIINMHLIANNGDLPKWMVGFGPGPHKSIKPPHWKHFTWTDPTTGIVLSGAADLILEDADGIHHLPDNKTAKFTENADKLLPMYDVQLNGYGIIWSSMGHKVGSFPLIYNEPVTGPEGCAPDVYSIDGFSLKFRPRILPIVKDPVIVHDLLVKAANILESDIPDGAKGCKDCAKIESIIGLAHTCCSMPPSFSEAMNSGDGTYRP